MDRKFLFLVLFLQLLVLCNNGWKNRDVKDETLVVSDWILANQLKSSPEKIMIAGKGLTLDTYLWSDFMPIAEGNENPLTGVIKFMGQSGDVLSNTISISKVYVVNNNEIWMCDSFETRIIEPDVFEVVVKKESNWDSGIDVDIICEFKDKAQSYRLMTKSQKINVTYKQLSFEE